MTRVCRAQIEHDIIRQRGRIRIRRGEATGRDCVSALTLDSTRLVAFWFLLDAWSTVRFVINSSMGCCGCAACIPHHHTSNP